MKWTLKDLPTAKSQNRKIMLKIFKLAEYREDIERGLPFFSEEELEELEREYGDSGMTRKDIINEAYKKGWLIKESTLKSYLQKDQLPRPLKRVKTDKGAVSIYPADTIRHLNFVRYCLFSGNKAVDMVISMLKKMSFSDEAHLEAASAEIDPSGMDGEDCITSIYMGVSRLETGLAWMEESIEKAFAEYSEKREQYLRELNNLKNIEGEFETKLGRFVKKLRAAKTPVDLTKFLSMAEKSEERGGA